MFWFSIGLFRQIRRFKFVDKKNHRRIWWLIYLNKQINYSNTITETIVMVCDIMYDILIIVRSVLFEVFHRHISSFGNKAW